MIKNVNFDEITAFLFGSEELGKMKAEALEKTEKAMVE